MFLTSRRLGHSFIKRSIRLISSYIMEETNQMTNPSETRQLNDEDCHVDDNVKRVKTEENEMEKSVINVPRIRFRKFVVLLSYCGHGYYGMQRQSWDAPLPTIEEDFLKSMFTLGMITEDNYKNSSTLRFQRSSRTDKGVSAIRQIISMNAPEQFNDHVGEINALLPSQIRVIAGKRTTKFFDCKNFCDARTYSYLMPSFALCPVDQITSESFRLKPETLKEFNDILLCYKGAHNFHNFTSQKKPNDPSAIRYIMEIDCGEPFVKEDLEFVVIRIRGQSFMLHQIRKMIGLAIAIIKGFAPKDTIEKAYGPMKLDIPRAPGLGLMLEEVHYFRYNKRYGGDGIHEPILWDEYNDKITEFKYNCIYPIVYETEKKDKSMLEWLQTLQFHTYDVREPGRPTFLIPQDKVEVKEEPSKSPLTPFLKAYMALDRKRIQTEDEDEDENEQDDGNEHSNRDKLADDGQVDEKIDVKNSLESKEELHLKDSISKIT